MQTGRTWPARSPDGVSSARLHSGSQNINERPGNPCRSFVGEPDHDGLDQVQGVQKEYQAVGAEHETGNRRRNLGHEIIHGGLSLFDLLQGSRPAVITT